MPVRLGIMLSGSGSTYANLVTAINEGTLPAEVAVVIASRTDCGGVDRARGFGHPVVIATTAAEVTQALETHRCDVVAMCGWLRYYDPPPTWQGRVFNIHPSLLPAYGGKGMYGMHVHRAVVAAGERESGCTVHEVSGSYDSGPLLAQARVPITSTDTPESVQAKVQAAERDLYPRVLAERIAAMRFG